MSNSRLAQRQSYYDNGTSTNYTTIIVVIVVILIIKICLIAFICYFRNKKKRERAARGCTCFESTDYYCLPWWYWSSDKRCHCGAMNRTIYNAPPAYRAGAGYEQNGNAGYVPDPAYPQYAMGPQAEAGQWNQQQQSGPQKPADQVYVGGRYHYNDGDY